ncbi:EGF-like domain protein [Ostertagia ostertagi]
MLMALNVPVLTIVLLLITSEASAQDYVEEELCDIETKSPCSAKEHEECRPQNASDKIGVCKCISGFARAFNGAPCLPLNTSSSETTNSTSNGTKGVSKMVPSVVQLPVDSAQVKVKFPDKEQGKGDTFSYLWELLQGTGLAFASSYKRPILELSQLKEGKLLFRVTVSNSTHTGQKQYTLTVEAPKAPNKPPRAIIRPESPVHGVEGSRLTLDAEGSVDDDKIVAFKWTQDKGPSIPLGAMNTPILTLDNMVAGSYVFSGGLTSSASTRVEIEAERDDPPKAHINECGSKEHTGSLTVRLPLPELNLCGNSSIDDKGIVSYNWFRVDKLSEKLSVDTAGSTTSILTLKKYPSEYERLGPYEFQLDVTDTKGQKDSTRISIFVNKAENFAPVADAGGNHTVILPENAIVLDGNAKDDGTAHLVHHLVNADKAKATASRLQEGVYRFLLTVVDDGGLNGTASAYITVERTAVARVANVTRCHLRLQIALDGTENTQIMFITGLVKGTHVYNLTVADQQKARNSILVYLTVIEGEEELESVEILLKKSIEEWTYRLRRKLADEEAQKVTRWLYTSLDLKKCRWMAGYEQCFGLKVIRSKIASLTAPGMANATTRPSSASVITFGWETCSHMLFAGSEMRDCEEDQPYGSRVSRRRFRKRKRYNPLRSESEDVEKEAYRMSNAVHG